MNTVRYTYVSWLLTKYFDGCDGGGAAVPASPSAPSNGLFFPSSSAYPPEFLEGDDLSCVRIAAREESPAVRPSPEVLNVLASLVMRNARKRTLLGSFDARKINTGSMTLLFENQQRNSRTELSSTPHANTEERPRLAQQQKPTRPQEFVRVCQKMKWK